MQRVAVIGAGGAGKSTFADRLGQLTGLPVIHLDQLFWRPGWEQTPREDWEALQSDLVAGDSWIMDGNYGASLALRLVRADTIVLFDLPRWLCLRRAVWRSLRNYGREVQAPGCPERLDREFLSWIWHFPERTRPRVLAAIDEHGQQATLHRLYRPSDADRLLADLSLAASAGGL
jgi:adenylate kinase family enzyme